jgi:hypothetical protein
MSNDNAQKRAIEDYSQFSQNMRASAQYVFLANGGAVVAMLSCLTAITTAKEVSNFVSISKVIQAFAYATAFHLVGVFLIIVATGLMSLAKQRWGHFWENIALTDEVDFRHPYAKAGTRLDNAGFLFLVLAALAFIPGSALAVSGFLR